MRTLKSEFPDWDGEDPMPCLIPFTFYPWRDEVCPGYGWEDPDDPELAGAWLQVCVDYVDPGRREYPGPRIRLVVYEGGYGSSDTLCPVSGETWDELREACNVWYTEHVGYRPDEGDGGLPMGHLLFDVGAMAYLHNNQ